MRTFSIPVCIKKALEEQGLEYKDGEIVKSQRRVSAEAKENGYGESEDERVRKEIIAILQYKYKNFSKDPKYCNAPQWIAWLEKQGGIDNCPLEGSADCVTTDSRKQGEQKPVNYDCNEDEKIRKYLISFVELNSGVNLPPEEAKKILAWLEKQESEPNWCHHKVDLSNCSEEYRKAYYDGWNNCNMQHSQCAWTEADDEELENTINALKGAGKHGSFDWLSTVKWLLTIKQRIGG